NLLCGCAGIVCAFTRPDLPLAWFVWAACGFDFLDGFSARLLKVSSAIGKELDSLADVVSFGVLPSVQLFMMMGGATGGPVSWTGFALAAFAALRLAKFNVDDRQTESFSGLPTPAMALFITGLPFVLALIGSAETPVYLPLLATVLMALAMVSPLPMAALKFKSLTWKGNQVIFLLLATSLVLIVMTGAAGIPLSILFYLFLSLLARFSPKTS
ncbi:MAG: CDP-alcohol phosphatidyltransferase family protein, partial [Bacteroidota bacterium]